MNFTQVKITTSAPSENADAIRQALGEAGAGVLGEYSFCSFSYQGQGRFTPSAKATPHIGEAHKLETVKEDRIEVTCERSKAKQVIAALRQVHPYEEPMILIVPLLSEEDL